MFEIFHFTPAGVGAGDTVRVFGLQEDSWKPPRNDVYIKYDFSKRNVS